MNGGVVTAEEMRALEAAAVASGRTEEELMREAGAAIVRVLREYFPVGEGMTAVVFAGKGHNAGDACVVADLLLRLGWCVVVRWICPEAEWRPLMEKMAAEVRGRVATDIPCEGALVVIDGLLGIGASGALRGPLRAAVEEMNALRRERHAFTVALDVPTGLGSGGPCVEADLTVTVGAVKRELIASGAEKVVGRLAVAWVAGLEADGSGSDAVVTAAVAREMLPAVRNFDTHKGQAGRVAVVAGSPGLLGAARLSAAAAVHGGAGLVTLFVPESIHQAAMAAAIPEVMVECLTNAAQVRDGNFSAVALGPGLGREGASALLDVMLEDPRPMVIDADGLNALARLPVERFRPPGPRLLTPHPGEMARLISAWRPQWADWSRPEVARAFAAEFGVTLLLKGARTLVAGRDFPLAHNTTGHPGMASGGMGDVLTGLCAALTAQGCPLRHAACLGSWLLGRSAELAVFSGEESVESLRATAVIDHLGLCLSALRRGGGC